jgi:hypothetical protein
LRDTLIFTCCFCFFFLPLTPPLSFTGGLSINLLLTALAGFAFSAEVGEQVIGAVCNIYGICLYAGGLSTLKTVIKTKNSSSINPLLVAALLSCGLLWTVYGFYVGKVAMAFPNLVGVALCGVQIYLIVKYPSKPGSSNGSPTRAATDTESLHLMKNNDSVVSP